MTIQDTFDINADDVPSAPVSYLFYLMGPESCREITSDALDARPRVCAELRDELNRAIKKNVAKVSGFRDSNISRAPSAHILPQLCNTILHSPDLATAIAKVWYESQAELRTTVASELENWGVTPTCHSSPAVEMRVGASTKLIYEALHNYCKTHPEQERNRVVFMFQLFTGVSDVDSNPEKEKSVITDLLNSTLATLSALPATSPDWDGSISEFSRSLTDLIESKLEQSKLFGPLCELLDSIAGEHANLLDFFQCDTSAWSLEGIGPYFPFQRAQEHGKSLGELLAQYSPIHERAQTVMEEMERARQRQKLFPGIIESIEALSLLFNGEKESETGESRGTEDDDSEPVCREEMDAASHLGAEGESELLAPFTQVPACDIQDLLLLRLICEDLEQENEELEHANDGLKQQVKSLEQTLHESRSLEKSLRWAVAHRDNPEETDEVPPPQTVKAAVELAQERYPGQLLFQLNAESDAAESEFKWPEQVWNALQWLATDYFNSHLGDIPIPDIDEACRRACGMWYKTSQHETTMTQFRDSYTTSIEGRRIWLREHIGKGNKLDPRRTIRIAFDWDRQVQKVVIGYIGQHQRTSAT